MNQPDIYHLLQRYQLGECTPEETQAVEAWYEALGHDQKVDLAPPAQAQLQARLWAGIARQTGLEPSIPVTAPAWWRQRWRQAAAAVLLAGGVAGAWWLRPAMPVVAVRPHAPTAPAPARTWVVKANTTAETLRIALQDGSVVALAPASQLRYPTQFQGVPRRQVYLSGEAFFEVFHNPAQPFQVYTDQVITTVLGTSFRVRAFAHDPAARVEVRTGRVRVTPNPARQPDAAPAALPASVVILPNQQAEYAPATHALKTALVAQPVVLTEQPLVFNDRPVAEVFAALEKAYGVAIAYDHAALANCTVSVVLQQNTLFGKLDLLCKTLNGSYQQVGTRIVVRAKGCPTD